MTVRSMMLMCCALAACEGASTQVLTGRIDTSKGALAIRAVGVGDVVTATPVRTDGSFTIALPSGNYRLEVLTRTGVKNVVMRSGNVLRDLSFKVCQPVDPFDVGMIGDPNTAGICAPGDANCTPCDPSNGTQCPLPPDPCADPTDPNCKPPCDPTVDPSCGTMCNADGTCCNAGDPNCVPPPPPPNCQPGDLNCPCMDPNGCPPPPPPCDPADPTCKCNQDGTCPPPPCMDANDPNCMAGCTDPNEPGCVPPCADPLDPTTCKDPCVEDPAACGCTTPDCWGEPQPCCDSNGMCDPSEGMAPDNIPVDFGCAEQP